MSPRHRHRVWWASNTFLSFLALISLVIAVGVSDAVGGEPPSYLVGLLGTAAGAFFAAISSDKDKRDADDAERAACHRHPDDNDRDDDDDDDEGRADTAGRGRG